MDRYFTGGEKDRQHYEHIFVVFEMTIINELSTVPDHRNSCLFFHL